MKKILWVCLVLTLGFGQTWERILPCYVNNVLYAGAYSGGVNYSRPDWVDIDGDGDYDLTIGGESGGMHFYRNIGSASSPSWLFVSEYYKGIDVDNRCSQAFVDIDDDDDYDLFIGEQDGNINFYRNVGSPINDTFVLVTENYNGIDVGSFSAPVFRDIDNDGDQDFFIGEHNGNLNFYRNDGTAAVPSWTLVSETWFGIDVGTKNIPWFADIDADGDQDLFIGNAEGLTAFYRNDGTASAPNMVFVTGDYIGDVGNTNAPTFVDIDADGDQDLFIGEYIGNVNFYRNNGTPQNPSWSFVRKYYLEIDLNSSSTPALADIDADGDLDLICGEWVGILDYYQNSGTSASHRWTIVSENYESIDVGDNSRPYLADIDHDGDYDLFVGNLLGQVYFYRNTGTPSAPSFTRIDTMYAGIDAGDRCAPAFVDIDADGDFDLFLGNDSGYVWFYRNTGTPTAPAWTLVSSHYLNINVGTQSVPEFADVDRDGDFDLFIGEANGSIWNYRNDGTASNPSFTLVTTSFAGVNVEENTAPVFGDLDADGDLDLMIGERWGGLNYYRQNVADLIPPDPPYIYARKTGSNVYLWWRAVTTDTAGNPENISRYVVYRSTSPSFVPGPADSIGAAPYPDTFFTNLSAVPAGQSYYYLVKAVDIGNNRSRSSNMGFKFNKFFNENPGATSDRNWTSFPWHNNFTTVNDMVTDLSLFGNPLIIVTNIRNDQYYESYFWDPDFGWDGVNFNVPPGRGFELVTTKDTTLYIVGANNPNGLVSLNENIGAVSDRNWISVPYNAVYSTVNDLVTTYSPSGNPLIIVTNIRNDQYYESYFWDPDFGWDGVNFVMEKGRAYEFVVTRDTTWNPTEYSNEGGPFIFVTQPRDKNIVSVIGTATESKRTPAWILTNGTYLAAENHRSNAFRECAYRDAGISHIVCARFNVAGFSDLTFTVYRMNKPQDALTDRVIGCGTARKGDLALLWFNAGNFLVPWKNGEEALLLIEAVKDGKGYFAVVKFTLDQRVDIQDLSHNREILLSPIPDPQVRGSLCSWPGADDPEVIGYSLYREGDRINPGLITGREYPAAGAAVLHPVVSGGYETVYGSSVKQHPGSTDEPVSYALGIAPNPFIRTALIRYALPIPGHLTISIYDIIGRLVKALASGYKKPGYYQAFWSGRDDAGRPVPSGVYFIRMKAGGFETQDKVLYLR